MANAISSDRLKEALARSLNDSAKAKYYASTPVRAKAYVQLRFFAVIFPEELNRVDYEAFREEVCRDLDRSDAKFLLQHERDLAEVRFLTGLLKRPASVQRNPLPEIPTSADEIPSSAGVTGGTSSRTVGLALAGVVGVLLAVAVWRLLTPHPEEKTPQEKCPPQAMEAGLPERREMPVVLSNEAVSDASMPLVEEPTSTNGVEQLPRSEIVPAGKIVVEAQAVEQVEMPMDASRTLKSLGGIVFGATVGNRPIVDRSLIEDGETLAACGVAYGIRSLPLGKTFSAFDNRPFLWVTPKTFRVFKIEFEGVPSDRPEVAEMELVTALKKRFSVDPVKLPGARHVFRLGETSVEIGVVDGHLKLVAEHAGLREEAKRESVEVRRMKIEDVGGGRRLDDGDYPNGGPADLKGVKFRAGTPNAFCGFVFGTLAPLGGERKDHGHGHRYFHVNYGGLKKGAFKGFSVGRAETCWGNGGLYAVTLLSSGSQEELDDREYLANLRDTVARHYGVEPVAQPDENGRPRFLYRLGDVEVIVGVDPKGGFFLHAENTVLASVSRREFSETEGLSREGK